MGVHIISQQHHLWQHHRHHKSFFLFTVAMPKKREWPKHPPHPLRPKRQRHKKEWSKLFYVNKRRIPKRSLPRYRCYHGSLPFRMLYPKDPQTSWRLQRLYWKAINFDPHMDFIMRYKYTPTPDWLLDYLKWYKIPVMFPNDKSKEELRVKIISSKLFRRAKWAHLYVRKAVGGSWLSGVKSSNKDRNGTTILLDSLYHRVLHHQRRRQKNPQKTSYRHVRKRTYNRPVMSWYISHLIERQQFVSWQYENSSWHFININDIDKERFVSWQRENPVWQFININV